MTNCPERQKAEVPILTEEDILEHVRMIRKQGYGHIEIDIFDHYIRTIKPTPTILGRRP